MQSDLISKKFDFCQTSAIPIAQVSINHVLPCPILTIVVASTTDASSIDIPSDFSDICSYLAPHWPQENGFSSDSVA